MNTKEQKNKMPQEDLQKISASKIQALKPYFPYVKPQPLPLSWPQLYETWQQYTNPTARFVFAGLYLTGQRVSEFTSTLRGDVNMLTQDGYPYIVVNSITEKNKQNPRRSVPIPMNYRDDELARYFWKQISYIENPDFPIFNKTERTIWNLLSVVNVEVNALNFETLNYEKVNLRIHPHYLRHCRATHLATDYNYGFLQLKKYFGWQTNNMPDLYTSLAWQDLAKEFQKGGVKNGNEKTNT